MATQTDITYSKFEDGTWTIGLAPPTAISGWTIRLRLSKHFGAESGLIPDKYLGSGYNSVSGLTIVNSAQGIFSATVNSADTSGLDYGNYAIETRRIDSGFNTELTQGFLVLTP